MENKVLMIRGTVPVGCKYIQKNVEYAEGEAMPEAKFRDQLITRDYRYQLMNPEKLFWRVHVLDKTKEDYEPLCMNINGHDLKCMDCAFLGCENMIEAPRTPDTVERMSHAYFGCTHLKDAYIPDNVTSMFMTFAECRNLERVSLPEDIKELYATFCGCESLKKVKLGKKVKNLGHTFDGCISLEEMPDLPDGIEILMAAFKDCKNLKSAKPIPSTVNFMPEAFSGCYELKGEVVIEAELNGFRNYKGCFDGCAYDTEHTITLKGAAAKVLKKRYKDNVNIVL